MMTHVHKVETRLALLLLLLPLAAGAANPGTTDPHSDPNEPLTPAALIARIMSTGSEQSDSVERLRPEDIMQRLWRNRITGPEPDDNMQTRADLEDLIQRVRSVRFETKKRPDAAQAAVNAVESASRDVTRTAAAAAGQMGDPLAARSAPSARALPVAASEALTRLLADPGRAHDPLEMAELLFLSGRPGEAAVLYQKALDLATGDGSAAKEDRAWILLQLGNCLRETDPTKAKSMYAKLIAEYPESPWVELAKAHNQLVLWHERVQPYQWVARQKAEPGSVATP